MKDRKDYERFTGKMNFDKAVHTLEGILRGIALDSIITEGELHELAMWRRDHAHEMGRHPFNEIIPRIDVALQDGVLSGEEGEGLLWLCRNFHTDSEYYDNLTSDIQRLHGILHGLLADGVLSDKEIRRLADWVVDNEHLKRCYPFDEIDSLLTAVLADGRIDDSERNDLKRLFDDFVTVQSVASGASSTKHMAVSGVCAVCPDIVFDRRSFCLTGDSRKVARAEIVGLVQRLGGRPVENVLKDLDYLVVCAGGNDCWAFACYGRKVEKAVNYRRQGSPIVIAHENDFWDAVADAGGA